MQCCETPNIDRIADEGMLFMDHYVQASCTVGRVAFVTGQHPLRVGLATVGMPRAEQGLQAEDPTLAEMVKQLGYRTGQFGKNHLGDRDEHLPTAHGFDEFYGVLYHLNAGDYPQQVDYPAEAIVAAGFGMRGIIHSYAGQNGEPQKIEELGPFGAEVQKHLDQDVLQESKRFITDAVAAMHCPRILDRLKPKFSALVTTAGWLRRRENAARSGRYIRSRHGVDHRCSVCANPPAFRPHPQGS